MKAKSQGDRESSLGIVGEKLPFSILDLSHRPVPHQESGYHFALSLSTVQTTDQ